MCGITGIFYTDGQPVQAEILERMTRILAHRGPDGEGIEVLGAAGLGQRRLSIIDLSPKGRQPMCNEDGTVWITFNGEIYNHQDIRANLEAKGHIFNSQTDTEAIIHGYEEYGADIVTRLNGMFAFALWDSHNQELFLARDRAGIKPLFYGQFGNIFLLGSEIKAILEHPACLRELDTDALDLFLSLNYTPGPYTMLRGIRQLEPGHWLRIKAGSSALHTESFWDIDYSHAQNLTFEAAREQFMALLQKAVERRLMSDVPLGAFLSGGIDSSSIVACMTAIGKASEVKTFSMGFGEPSFNEAPFAREVADHLKTQHHEQMVTPDLAAILPKLVWHAEDPLADSSMVPVYYLSKMTREHVTVALSGDGSDEILAGYPTHIATQWARMGQFLPYRLLQSTVQPLLQAITPVSDRKISPQEKLLRLVNGMGLNWQEAHATWRQIHTEKQKATILKPGVFRNQPLSYEIYRDYYTRCNSSHWLDGTLYVDTRFYLPNDMLVKVDRMSMAHSLEARVPFLDHELIEFAASLPPAFKLHRGTGKYILREAIKPYLPKTTLKRQKTGFNIPAGKWLREDLSELLHDTLSVKNLSEAGIWQVKGVQQMMKEHRECRRDNGHQLWGVLTFMLWWQQFMQKKEP